MQSRLARSWILVMVVALVAAACGDDGASTDDGLAGGEAQEEPEPEPEPDPEVEPEPETEPEPPELTASYRGVTEDTIRIGIVLFDLDAILELGVDVGYGDQTQHYQVIIDEINEAGGILGRTLEPIYRLISPVDSSQSDAVCVELIEDHEVFVVLGTLRPPENVLCYTEAGDTPFIGAPSGDLTDEVFERSVVPFLYPGRVPSRTDSAIISALELDDAIDGQVLAVHGRDDVRLASLEDELRARGATEVITTKEVADEADQLALATELDTFVQRYIADQVSGVINTGDNVAFLAAFNRSQLKIPVWTTSGDVVADFIYDQGATDEELALVRRIGGQSGADLYEAGHQPTVECVDRWNRLRPDELVVMDPGDDDLNNFGVVVGACIAMDLLVTAATAAGPDLTVASFTAALDDIGSFETAGIRSASVSSTKWDISDAAKLYRWDEASGEFQAAEDLVVD